MDNTLLPGPKKNIIYEPIFNVVSAFRVLVHIKVHNTELDSDLKQKV